ncbi:MAG: hypothetical protein PWP23_1884 [Candidatus Sumerlaeota bacterium]|nr:hypothetical protein [Candidatus Sumerlaeota bacterium]
MRSHLLATLAVIAMCTTSVPAQDALSLVVTEFMASNSSGLVDGTGSHPDWIEIHNPTASSVALTGCYMTDDATETMKWAFPASPVVSVPAGGYLIVMASGNASDSTPYFDSLGYVHTSFKLSAGGESALLVASDGTTIISGFTDFPSQETDISYGIGANGSTGYLKTATPGAANGDAASGVVADTKFSVNRGFFTDPFDLEITTETAGATIRYTLDGSTPSETNGTIYTGPISVSGTTIVRAFAYRTDWFSTNVDTQTYIFLSDVINQPSTKPSSSWPDPYQPSSGGGGGPGGGPPGGGGGTSSQAIDYGMDSKVTGDSRYSSLMDDALLAIPSISLVTDLPNLFDTSTGIYANPETEGLECPGSVELIWPDGTEGFQADGAIRIRGGSSTAKTNPKHSFRVIMKSDYGDSKIEYPLLGEDGPETFDKIDFRTAQNFSWNQTSPEYANWLEDPFTRDTMRDMGHPSTEGFFFHLYLDGLYWGLYQIEERPDAHFCESYLGGNDDDFDVVKSDEDTGVMYATDGSTDFYNAFWTEVNAGVTTIADYYRLQGLNADGTENASYPRYLDADNLIDYMLIVFYTGAQDMPLGPPNQPNKPRNLYAVANREDPDGFKFLPHDNEWSLLQSYGVSINRVSFSLSSGLSAQSYFNPWWLHSQLKANSEYVMDFADRVHRHFFNGGALTAEAATARYMERKNEIDLAIIAESARWGDYLSPNDPRTRDDDWLPAVNWVLNNFIGAFPQTRTEIVLGQLRSAGLYPTVDAPVFSRQSGEVAAGESLVITADSGTIYYTTDGSDPRQIGGSPLPGASTGTSGMSLVLNSTTTLKARAYSGGTWSALNEATFTVEGTASAGSGWILY